MYQQGLGDNFHFWQLTRSGMAVILCFNTHKIVRGIMRFHRILRCVVKSQLTCNKNTEIVKISLKM